MKIDHLTFGQLLKLSQPQTLMRVTRTYHSALRAAWDRHFPGRFFFVQRAALAFPPIARRYLRVLDFLTGPELKRATRLAAIDQRIPISWHETHTVRVCDYYTFHSQKEAFQLARLCVSFCEALNVPAKIVRHKDRYVVLAATTELGKAALLRHPGPRVEVLRQFLADGNVPLSGPFWWLPNGLPPAARVNPLLRCINTPDYQEYAKEIVFQ